MFRDSGSPPFRTGLFGLCEVKRGSIVLVSCCFSFHQANPRFAGQRPHTAVSNIFGGIVAPGIRKRLKSDHRRFWTPLLIPGDLIICRGVSASRTLFSFFHPLFCSFFRRNLRLQNDVVTAQNDSIPQYAVFLRKAPEKPQIRAIFRQFRPDPPLRDGVLTSARPRAFNPLKNRSMSFFAVSVVIPVRFLCIRLSLFSSIETRLFRGTNRVQSLQIYPEG